MDLPDKDWFWISEAAQLLGISRMTLYRWIEKGEVECKGRSFFRKVSKRSLLEKLGNTLSCL